MEETGIRKSGLKMRVFIRIRPVSEIDKIVISLGKSAKSAVLFVVRLVKTNPMLK